MTAHHNSLAAGLNAEDIQAWLRGYSVAQLLEHFAAGFAAGKSQIHITEALSPEPPLPAQLRIVHQQDLPLGHASDAVEGSVSVSGGDEGGVDICPARRFSTARRAAFLSNTRRIKKGPFTDHHTIVSA